MSVHSIVEYLGESSKEKCGYCKETGGYNSFGFWAHSLSPDDYQTLINRNWRRSGQYVYLPTNSSTCCPMYTIKCDADNFKLTRSHKKVLKRMNKFLKDGSKEKNFNRQNMESGANDPKPSKEPSKLAVDDIKMEVMPGTSNPVKKILKPDGEIKVTPQTAPAAPRITNPSKKKVIRLERKIAKLAAKGLTLNDIKPRYVNKEKTLEDFIAEEPQDGKHKLKVSSIIISKYRKINEEILGKIGAINARLNTVNP